MTIRVLIVEDQNMVLGALAALLETERDIEVVGQARNGEEALGLIATVKPDVVMTDIEMPRMTGLELAQECCRIDAELGVLYVSGSSPGDALRSDLNAERHGFLAKPFRASELLRSARALLDMEPSSASCKIRGSQTERFSMEG